MLHCEASDAVAWSTGVCNDHMLSAEGRVMCPRHPRPVINGQACWLACSGTPSADSLGGLQSLEQKIKRKVPAAVQQLLSHEATLEGMRRRSQVPPPVPPRALLQITPPSTASGASSHVFHTACKPGTTQSAFQMPCMVMLSHSHRPQTTHASLVQ